MGQLLSGNRGDSLTNFDMFIGKIRSTVARICDMVCDITHAVAEHALDFWSQVRLEFESEFCDVEPKLIIAPPSFPVSQDEEQESKLGDTSELEIASTGCDIISKLVDMHLENIVIDNIFLQLSKQDIANAVTAVPRWSQLATSTGRLRKLLSSTSSSLLKTHYRKEELLAEQKPDLSADTASIFKRACLECSKMTKFRINKHENIGTVDSYADLRFKFSISTERSGSCWFVHRIHVSDEFITAVMNPSVPEIYQTKKQEERYLVVLFDRWTFKLINSLCVKRFNCYEEPHFIADNAVLMSCFLKPDERVYFIWNPATNQVDILPCSRAIYRAFCVGKLIVLLRKKSDGIFATIFKGNIRLMDDEPLNLWEPVNMMRSGEELDCFALFGPASKEADHYVIQMRCKQDFSLMRAVTVRRLNTLYYDNGAFLLSDRFVFMKRTSAVDVWALVSCNDYKAVYRFEVGEHCAIPGNFTSVTVTGGCLILHSNLRQFECHAAIWKLPSGFVEICERHLKMGTVGVKSECDQLILEDWQGSEWQDIESFTRIDRFGVSRYHCDTVNPTVVNVAMLKSIISDEDVL